MPIHTGQFIFDTVHWKVSFNVGSSIKGQEFLSTTAGSGLFTHRNANRTVITFDKGAIFLSVRIADSCGRGAQKPDTQFAQPRMIAPSQYIAGFAFLIEYGKFTENTF